MRSAIIEAVRLARTSSISADDIAAHLSTAPSGQAPLEGVVKIEHDGFEGDIIGRYVTREGKRGVVLQQVGTKVVHVYGEKWLSSALLHASAEPVAITKGLLSDEDAKTAGLGRFGHHPDPAIDFEIEVESLEARLIDAKGGISKPGTSPETVACVLEDIQRAMEFRVGGDPSAVSAKQTLRKLERDASPPASGAVEAGWQDECATEGCSPEGEE